MGHFDDGRGAEENLGARRARQDHSLEPGRPEWPNEKIALFGAGADSGTFDYFTEAIVGKAKSSRGDYTASEDDNVLVQGVEGNKYALGYIPYAYYAPHSNRMKAVAIEWEKNKVKEPVLPSPENVLGRNLQPAVASAVHLRQSQIDG